MDVDDDEDLKYSMCLDAACRLLQIYLLDELRIRLGKVYNVGVENSRNSLCTFFLISIGLSCHPSDVDAVKTSIREVLASLQAVGPDVAKLGNVLERMFKTHKDAATNSSYWLFWILDSYKAFKLHQWRCVAHADHFFAIPSSQWLGRNGHLRASGKLSFIKEGVCVTALKNIYQSVFNLNKSVLMTLRPDESVVRQVNSDDGASKVVTCDQFSGSRMSREKLDRHAASPMRGRE